MIGVIAPDAPALVGTLALALPLLVGGNSVVALVSERAPFVGMALGEVAAASDVPAGALNLLSGHRDELAGEFAKHRNIDGLLVAGAPDAELTQAAADNVKRVRFCDLSKASWNNVEKLRALSWVEPFVETKTLWHPVAP